MARAVESADKVVVSVKRSYEGGLRTVLDVLNAEQQAQQARRDLGEARLLYVASRMRLLALAGELDAQAVQGADGWFCASDCGTMQSSSSEVQISR
jgi:outer membrane protein/protease secretion system outer membrane protein